MIRLKRALVLTMLVGVVVAGLVAGCSKFDPGQRRPNIAPETTLSFSPDSGSVANYKVRMNWFGWDVDGEVVFFETAWDKPDTIAGWSDWIDDAGHRVISTDSLFYVAADDEYDEANAYAVHSFGVRAVDNEGARDPSPEYISFTAQTVLPETYITRGPAVVTGPMVTFEWEGRDRDGVIVTYDYRLFRREAGEWVQKTPNPLVAESITVDASVTSVIFGPLEGLHRFEVWATDDAGARDLTPAVSQFTCNPTLAGPKLYIGTNVFGSFSFRGPVWPPSFNLPLPIFSGERLAFGWVADANDYGGEVLGYRHAYDDTSTWPAWSIFDRYFRVTPTIGRHSLYVSALDNSNVMTRARIYFDVVEASLDDYILIVDDYDWREGNPEWGTDADRSEFYNRMLAGYERDRFEWEPAQHIVSGEAQPPDVDALRGASTVIWYCDYQEATIANLFDPWLTTYNSLAGYLRVGGNIVLSGQSILGAIMDEPYPFSIGESDTSAAGVFIRDFLHIGYANSSGQAANKNSPWNYGWCCWGAVPSEEGEAFGFESVYIDTGVSEEEPGKWFPYWWTTFGGQYFHCGTSRVERLQAFQGEGLEIYEIDAFLNMNYEGQPCGILYLSGDNRSNSCYLSLPLYYYQEPQVKAYLDRVLELFGEEKIQQ